MATAPADDAASGFYAAARVFADRLAQARPEPAEEFLRRHEALLPDLFIVSRVSLEPVPSPTVVSQRLSGLAIGVAAAAGVKCERCWKVLDDVGSDAAHPTACGRCAAAVRSIAAGRGAGA